ncbi:WD repeat-containing protein 66 [Plasmodium brasilianum]|uniref:WD repeat-containing protein 66 n=1 Tax=Plasmodium brasilianum TaxID=5824 RepID=A0ACB9YDH0_PLABR|nr:WD repeat-containing protein 66 [Plasmodium brasilianum]
MKNEHIVDEPINLKFCYGINTSYSSVHAIKKREEEHYEKRNEATEEEEEGTVEEDNLLIIYSSDNNIVMLDEKKQVLFRGHFNKITKISKSYNNNFILSCDKGINSFIILWKVSNNSLDPIKKFCFNNSQQDDTSKNMLKQNLDKSILHDNNEKETVTQQINESDINTMGYECVDISFDNRYICALTEKRIYIKSSETIMQKNALKMNDSSDGTAPVSSTTATTFTAAIAATTTATANKRNNTGGVYFQDVVIFDINGGGNHVICTDRIYGKEGQGNIRFNKKYEIVSNSSSKLYIYNFDKKNRTINHYSPSLYKSNKIHEQFIFTETSFLENSTTLLTGTTNGYLIIWDYSSIFINKTKHNIKQREYQKSLEIRKNIPINIVLSYGNFIILGLNDGCVQVFDNDLKCYAWFENKKIGAIKSLSFEYSNFQEDFFTWNPFVLFTDQNIIRKIYPNSFHNREKSIDDAEGAQIDTSKLNDNGNHIQKNVRRNISRNRYMKDNQTNEILQEKENKNFYKIDKQQEDKEHLFGNGKDLKMDDNICNIHKEITMNNLKKKNMNHSGKNKTILHFNSSCINCICTNPVSSQNVIYIGNENGLIEVFDFDKNEKVNTLQLAEKEITSMIFSNNGKIFCVGCKCGYIQLMNSSTFQIFFSSKDLKYEISYLCFSEDDKILICSSVNANIIIYRNQMGSSEKGSNERGDDENGNYNSANYERVNGEKDNLICGYWNFAYKIINSNNITFNDLNIVKEVHNNNQYIIIAITNNRFIIFHHYNFNENIVSISYLSIEQVYTPTCLSGNLYYYNRQILCICNEASKIRFFDLETKKIIKTIHLPFRDKRVKHFLPLIDLNDEKNSFSPDTHTRDTTTNSTKDTTKKVKNDMDSKKNIFLFILNEKMIVFTQTPIDANCFRYLGVIVCSGNIKNVISKNKNVFILSNNKIFYYNINSEILKKSIQTQSNTLETFIEQIGGKRSKIYNQIMDSFYYCEIQKKKYQQKKQKHDIKKLLNILSIEYIFASINIFLSKFEIQNIIQEYHFYYKYVLQLLKQKGSQVNEIFSVDDVNLVSYKSDGDILLQNVFFADSSTHKDERTECNGHLLSYSRTQEKTSIQDIKILNSSEANNYLNKKTNTEVRTQEDPNALDIVEDCENIYFNINAFIYTYFNFAIEGEINFQKVIEDIGNYYKEKNMKKYISYNDLMHMLRNYGEIMDENEFKKIFQIFTKKEESFNAEDILDLGMLKKLLQ